MYVTQNVNQNYEAIPNKRVLIILLSEIHYNIICTKFKDTINIVINNKYLI